MDASAPPPSRERIATLDLIRGLAVLGILVGGLMIAMYLPIFKLGAVV